METVLVIKRGTPQPKLAAPGLDEDKYRATVGERLRNIRLGQGLTLRTVGAAAGISTSAICKIERGVTKNVDIGRVAVLAQAYGVDPAQVLGGGNE